jgi:hypothetical protein
MSNGIDVENGNSNDLYESIHAGYAALIQAYELDEQKNNEEQ